MYVYVKIYTEIIVYKYIQKNDVCLKIGYTPSLIDVDDDFMTKFPKMSSGMNPKLRQHSVYTQFNVCIW